MPQGRCRRHGNGPCSCGMGNIYRFVEPVVLFLLKTKGRAHGYELAGDLAECALTDSSVDMGGLYRILQRLEGEGFVVSEWDTSGAGAARRMYAVTPAGEDRLREWVTVLGNMTRSMNAFLEKTEKAGIVPLAGFRDAQQDMATKVSDDATSV